MLCDACLIPIRLLRVARRLGRVQTRLWSWAAVAITASEEAEKAGLPIFSYPLLARALYFTGEVGGEIHTELYRAVAAILSFVFHANSEGDAPVIDVPKELQFDANGRSLERRRV